MTGWDLRCHVIPGRNVRTTRASQFTALQAPCADFEHDSYHFDITQSHPPSIFIWASRSKNLPTTDSRLRPGEDGAGAGKACGTSAFGGLVLNQNADRCPTRARFHNSTLPFPSVPREQTTRPIFILPNCSACRATRSCSVLAQLRASGGSQAPAAGRHATEALLNPTSQQITHSPGLVPPKRSITPHPLYPLPCPCMHLFDSDKMYLCLR